MARRHRLIGLLALAGCSQTTIGPPSTLAPLTTGVVATSTTVVTVLTTELSGFVVTVIDGRSFDLRTDAGVRRVVLESITVPDISTCEGTEARHLLAGIIAGKEVRFDAAGIVWMNDIDVAAAMVAYGRAASATQPVTFSCANTTTTTIQVVVITRPRPRPTAAQPVETTPEETTPEAPPEASPPNSPQPVNPVPSPEPVTIPEPDPTPRVPETPRTPDTPATPGT